MYVSWCCTFVRTASASRVGWLVASAVSVTVTLHYLLQDLQVANFTNVYSPPHFAVISASQKVANKLVDALSSIGEVKCVLPFPFFLSSLCSLLLLFSPSHDLLVKGFCNFVVCFLLPTYLPQCCCCWCSVVLWSLSFFFFLYIILIFFCR